MIDYTSPKDGMKVTIIGDGAWGTALGVLLFEKGYDVKIWGAFPEYTKELISARQNYRYLPGIPLPEKLAFTSNLDDALADTRLIVMAVPSHVMREVAHRVAGALPEPAPFVNVAKGLEEGTLKRMSQVIQEETDLPQVATLSGPSHAEEVARKKPTAVTAAAQQLSLAEFVQEVFSCDTLRVYSNTDIIGVEYSATLKNIIAVAAGVVDGCEYGDNAKSALLTRSLVEMIRFGTAMGGQVESFFGLAGVGDLITTCFSKHGRNRAFGERIAKGMSVQDAINASVGVVEGYRNAKAIHELATKLKIEMPVTEVVYKVLYENMDIQTALVSLMTREKKSEFSMGKKLEKWLKLQLLRLKVTLTMG